MPWSTREIAELAGTTVNTVRHYHALGLLPEPERLSNGYKQYTVGHLVRLLRIRRLADLGVRLSEVDADEDTSVDALHQLDQDLQLKIEQLTEARSQVAALLQEHAPAHTPAGFEALGGTMSNADQALIHLYSELYQPEALDDVRSMMESSTEASARFDALPPDADEEARAQLAADLAPTLAAYATSFPWLYDPTPQFAKDQASTRAVLIDALREMYNPAQLDVLARSQELIEKEFPDRA